MTDLATYTPPPEVQTSAKKGLELARQTGLVSSPHIRSVGQALANGEPHTKERLRHIASFLKLHSQDASVSGWGNEESPSPAWVSWLMHGGEAGRAWANKHVGKVDLSSGYPHKDFLSPELEQQQAAAPRPSQEELADAEYAAILNRSDPRVLIERGGRIPPNPLAPKEPPVPGSAAEYNMLLDKSDPRIRASRRKK